MMSMSLYVAWRLYAAKSTDRNLRIVAFVPCGLFVKHSDNAVTVSVDNVYRY